MLNDGESQAGASHLAGTRLVNSIKTLEEAGQVSRGNSDTVISDRDAHLIVLGSRDLHAHFAIRTVELHGIVQEIHQRLLEVDPLTEDRNFLNMATNELDAAALRLRFHGPQGGFQSCPD